MTDRYACQATQGREKPFVSVIIPTYNRDKMLRLTIESFFRQSYPADSFEIIVSDNNSTDNTKDIVAELQQRAPVQINYLFEKRQGVHYARNCAAKIAKGDILYFTDDDMVADNRLLDELIKIFGFDQRIGVATGLVVGKFEVEPPAWVRKHMINERLSLTDSSRREELIISPDDCGVYSCHEAIRKDVFFKAGGFNPENTSGVWVGDGETGLNIRVKALGYKFAYTSKSIICHMIPQGRTTLNYLIKRIGNQGFCDSYTEYRRHRKKGMILPIMVRRNTIGLLKTLGVEILRIATGRISWRFIPAQLVYFYKRNEYDMKLYRNDNFRDLVEIDDWINSDRLMEF